MKRARTYKELLRVFTKMMLFINPLPVLMASLALQILLEGKKLYDQEKIQALREQIDDIREEIESLKTKQDKLKLAQHDSLRQYIKVKDKKAELTQQIQALKKELEPSRETINLDSLAEELSKRKAAQKEVSMSQVCAAFGIYGAMMSAETKVDLEIELLKLAAMLEKWCGLTGQTPAHRLVNKAEEEDTDKSLSTDQEQNQEIISYGKQRHR